MQPQALRNDKVEISPDIDETSGDFVLPENSNEFNSLRQLLLSDEQQKIAELENQIIELKSQIDSIPPASAKEVSDVLPAAIKKSSNSDNKLSLSTLPIVEENIKQSVKENPQILTEALFPVIGPAIRKAIADALGSMIQSLNQTIEHSFSPQSLKWRLEAFQTGKPFAEVVLLKTLLYRVEQIFLIHRDSGLLLQHVTANANVEQDADMVSAMLTAIQDFVKDSFLNSPDATLDTLQVGELAVWIERSGNLLFAAVIRGNAPLKLREEFKNAIEQIEFDHEADFLNFQGNSEPFERDQPILEACLKFQTGDKSNKKKSLFSPFNLATAALLLAICVVGFFLIRDYLRWSGYVSDLKNRPGIVVTDARNGWFKSSVQGLRDPLAANPVELMKDYKLNSDDIQSTWEDFQSSNAEIVQMRAKIIQGSLTDLQTKIENQTINFVCKTTDFERNQTNNLNEIGKNIETLSTLAMNAKKVLKVEIQGSSDGSGAADANSKISQARAEKTLNSLTATFPNLKNVDIKANALGTNANIGCNAKFKLNLLQ